MENRQNDEIVKNLEQSERKIIVSPSKRPWKERSEKLLKIRKILLIAVLLISALPLFVCAFGNENAGVGGVIFVLSIILIFPVGIGYIITLIQTIWSKKKAGSDYIAPSPNMVEILALPTFAVAYGLAVLIEEGMTSAWYGFDMLEVYCIIGFAVLLLDLLVGNWKEVLKNKTVQLTLLAFLPLFVLITFMRISILPLLSVSALLVAVASVLLYKKSEKFADHLFTKKQFKVCFSAAIAAFVLCCAFSIASPIVTTKRISDYLTKWTEDLKGKIFITDNTNEHVRGYVFDSEGNYRSIYEDGDQGNSYNLSVQINWFGFGTVRLSYPFNVVTYDVQGNAVAFVHHNYNSKETVYKLSDSIPCFKHEFGEYVMLEEAKSCQEPGSRKRTCVKCGYEETSTVTAPHTYVNGKCTVCGEKEPVEISDIKADTWYVYNPIPQLKFQNCEVSLATPQGGGARLMLTYYPVCSHCHARGMYQLTTVSNEKTDFYYCPECDSHTVIAFAIVL